MDEEDFTQDGSIFMDVPDACYEEYVEDQEELMEELQSSGDYGGMNDETYEGIVQFKKSGSLPEFVVTNEDRNARSHWKYVVMIDMGHARTVKLNQMKCMKYELLYDNLIYVNKDVESGGRPRFVVLPILTTVHNKIGHLGMKRTQAAVLQCFYWRSVRADVQRFVGTCSFCNLKKNSGKKVLKAPIDVFGPDVLEVGVRPCVNGEYYGANRFVVKLRGVPDNIALSTRTKLSGYTFKQKHLHVKRERRALILNVGKFLSFQWGTAWMVSMKFIVQLLNHCMESGWVTPILARNLEEGGRLLTELENKLAQREALNQLSIPSSKVSPKHEDFCEEADYDHSAPFPSMDEGMVASAQAHLSNGLAARYVAENQLKLDFRESNHQNANVYEFNIEYWHLPPTYGP